MSSPTTPTTTPMSVIPNVITLELEIVGNHIKNAIAHNNHFIKVDKLNSGTIQQLKKLGYTVSSCHNGFIQIGWGGQIITTMFEPD